jgi:hypothetical protein
MKTEEGIAELEKYNRDIKIREMGMKAAHNIIDYGAPTWYEWCNCNWGTKWNSCEAWGSAGKYDINFTTAWSPVYPIAQKLSEQYPGIIVSISGADEFAPSMFPTVMYVNGEEIMRHEEDDTEESWGDLWGWSPDEEFDEESDESDK